METNNLNTMCDWERKKAIFLMNYAESIGMNTSGYGEVAVNQSSGYTYLWLEDYPFCLYMPINCDLKESDIYCMWTNYENGEEFEMSCEDVTNINELYDFCNEMELDNLKN